MKQSVFLNRLNSVQNEVQSLRKQLESERSSDGGRPEKLAQLMDDIKAENDMVGIDFVN